MTREEAIDFGEMWLELQEEDSKGSNTYEFFKIAIKALKQEPKWIPVSERLPEHLELVLFSTRTDKVFEGRYFADTTDRQWFSFRDECFEWNDIVTAWMPLLKPYKVESENKG